MPAIRVSSHLRLLTYCGPVLASVRVGSGSSNTPSGAMGDGRSVLMALLLGTPGMLTDSARRVRWRWHSTPFSHTLPDENSHVLGAVTFNLRFPGQYYDEESGLHYSYYRDYDPQTGRYVQSDPIGLAEGLNTYAYCLTIYYGV